MKAPAFHARQATSGPVSFFLSGSKSSGQADRLDMPDLACFGLGSMQFGTDDRREVARAIGPCVGDAETVGFPEMVGQDQEVVALAVIGFTDLACGKAAVG